MGDIIFILDKKHLPILDYYLRSTHHLIALKPPVVYSWYENILEIYRRLIFLDFLHH